MDKLNVLDHECDEYIQLLKIQGIILKVFNILNHTFAAICVQEKAIQCICIL